MSYCRIDRRSGRVTQRAGSVAGLQGYDPLGFSLKPPKWIRKAQPGKFVQKHALAIAAVGASFLIPGVAPLALKAVTGAGKLAFGGARGLVTGAKVLGRGTAGLLKSKLPTIANRPAPSPGWGIFQRATDKAASSAATALLPPAAAVAPASASVSAPDFMGPPMPSGGGGSGGGGGSPESAATENAAQPAQAGLGAGALAIGALIAIGIFASNRGKRKQ